LIVVVVDPFAVPAGVACKEISVEDRRTHILTTAEGEALVVVWLGSLKVTDFVVGERLVAATAYAWKVGQDLLARGCVDRDASQKCAASFGLIWQEYPVPVVCFLCSVAGGLGGWGGEQLSE
jgi:hypothetical protein